MKNMNIKKEWDFVIFETHNEKPNKKNRLKREVLFIMQCLLNKLSEKRVKEVSFLKMIYLKTKEKYLAMPSS